MLQPRTGKFSAKAEGSPANNYRNRKGRGATRGQAPANTAEVVNQTRRGGASKAHVDMIASVPKGLEHKTQKEFELRRESHKATKGRDP